MLTSGRDVAVSYPVKSFLFRQPGIISPRFKQHRLLGRNVGGVKWAERAEATALHQDDEDESIAFSRQRLMDSSAGTSSGSRTRQRSGRLTREQT